MKSTRSPIAAIDSSGERPPPRLVHRPRLVAASPHTAFTLIELLAATALSAAMMVVVLGVIAGIGRSSRAMVREEAAAPGWQVDLVEVVRRDLMDSTGMRVDRGGVTLVGHAALDRATLDPRHLPASVRYEIIDIAGRTWLTRRQAPRDAFDGPAPWRELLLPDVTHFAIVSAPGMGAGGMEPGPSAEPGADGLLPIPSTAVVTLRLRGGGMIEETLVLR